MIKGTPTCLGIYLGTGLGLGELLLLQNSSNNQRLLANKGNKINNKEETNYKN